MGACFSKARRSSPWPDLPPELLGLILSRLPSYADRLSFRAVCRHWRLAAKQQRPALPPALPWLHQRCGTYQSLADGKLHRFAMPPEPCLKECCCGAFAGIRSFGSWVLHEHYDLHRPRCSLRNPFSGATVDIPPWRRDDGHESFLGNFVAKVVVCSSDLVAAMVYEPSRVAFFRPGARSWSLSPADTDPIASWYKDIPFFHGNLYAISRREGLFLHDPELGRPVEHVIRTRPPATSFSELPYGSQSVSRHLVVSQSGKLLMVRWPVGR